MPETEIGRQTLAELRNMHDELNGVRVEMAQLTEQVKAVARALEHTTNHGERIRALETEVFNLRAAQRSAATERRWVIGTVITLFLGLAATATAIVALFLQHRPSG